MARRFALAGRVGTAYRTSMETNEPLPELVLIGNPRLMQPQLELGAGSEDLADRLRVLALCMDHYQGIGIAAPQIGWWVRAFCIGIRTSSDRYPGADPIPFRYWINPRIVSRGRDVCYAWEGCLSVPGMRGWVGRPRRISVEGWDEEGNHCSLDLDGFAARVFQHEFDHLDGILFPQRVEHPRWLLPNAAVARQEEWPENWPSAGARITGPGQLSEVV